MKGEDKTKILSITWAENNSETSFKLAYVFRALLPDLTDIMIDADIVFITNLRNAWE
jgi:hypothetical protein